MCGPLRPGTVGSFVVLEADPHKRLVQVVVFAQSSFVDFQSKSAAGKSCARRRQAIRKAGTLCSGAFCSGRFRKDLGMQVTSGDQRQAVDQLLTEDDCLERRARKIAFARLGVHFQAKATPAQAASLRDVADE